MNRLLNDAQPLDPGTVDIEIQREEDHQVFDIATVSDMCIDLILAGNVRPRFGQVEQIVDRCEVELGGSANIFACQAAKLGAQTAVLGKVGPDHFGDFALARLREEGVDVSLVQTDPDVQTGLGVTLTEPADRAILTFLGSIVAVKPEDLPAEPAKVAAHWHLASLFLLQPLRNAWPEFLSCARDGGATTSLDTNWDPEERWAGVEELLSVIDVFLPNDAEASAISGEPEPLAAARKLGRAGSLVVVKCGKRGAIAVEKERVWEFHPETHGNGTVVPVDTIGAGDNFDAGFLWAWKLGWTLPECLKAGHECAASSLQAAGGIKGQLRRKFGDREK